MEVYIKSSKIRFRNPNVGQPTRAIEDHYIGRRVIADVGGEEQSFTFTNTELPFNADESEIISAIEQKQNAR